MEINWNKQNGLFAPFYYSVPVVDNFITRPEDCMVCVRG